MAGGIFRMYRLICGRCGWKEDFEASISLESPDAFVLEEADKLGWKSDDNILGPAWQCPYCRQAAAFREKSVQAP